MTISNSATAFFEVQRKKRWGDSNLHCPHCELPKATYGVSLTLPSLMPFRCRDCRNHFSVRTSTVLAESQGEAAQVAMGVSTVSVITVIRKGVSYVMQMASFR